MEKFGLKGLVINSDTIHEAQLRREDLWEQATTGPNLLFLAPEQLASPGFNALAKEDSEFAARVCAIAVDEAHLLNTWGKSWRKAFRQIGWVRARFSDVVLIAMTATMRGGKHIEAVCEFLGLHRGRFHLIRRSNARPDTQILFRTMKSNFGGKKFPELDWVLPAQRKTVIFCKSIHLGYRVNAYLHEQAAIDDWDPDKRIRMYNALNWPDYNAETRQLMEDDPDCQIAIGTDTMSVGVDISCVEDVIIIGEPEDVDDLFQKFGRVGRDRTRVTNPRSILYLGQGAVESARRIVEARDSPDANLKLRKGDTMDISIAEMVLAPCKYNEQDRQYDNPQDEIPCTCRACLQNPPPHRMLPCNCSGTSCMPEVLAEPEVTKAPTSRSVIPRKDRLTKSMRVFGDRQLKSFRYSLWENADEKSSGMLPLTVFLPDSEIKLILDSFSTLITVEALTSILKHNPFLTGSYDALFKTIDNLRHDFNQIREADKERARASRAERAAAKKAAAAVGSIEESGGELSESESDGNGDVSGVQPAESEVSGIKLRINLK